MKRAFLDQLFLGFLLLMGIASFVATVSDEMSTRNKIFDLKQLALKTSQTLARSYENNMNMCYGKEIAEGILRESSLGEELLAMNNSGKLLFDYDYYDLEPKDTNGNIIGDNQPDTVITKINGYKDDTFWYRLFNFDSFDLGDITAEESVNTPRDVTIRYGDRPSASYKNMMGTYELDSDNCVTNMKLYMANSKDYSWEQVVDPSDPDSPRIPIADGITSPPTYVFAIANGYNHFNQPSNNAPITLENQHCFDSTTYPKVTINGKTVQGVANKKDTGHVFFEHDQLNADGYNHLHIIPKSIIDDYTAFKSTYTTGTERDKYLAFTQYADALNADANPDNDIDYINDPNDEYNYALEDLDAGASDFDFTDLLLDSTRLIKENDTDNYTVNADHKIVFDSDYCESLNNTPPTLVLTGCPLSTQEDTSASSISWVASDVDGSIQSKDISTSYGSATINANGTITYTPDSNYYGEDTIIMVVTDDDDAIAKEECKVIITEVNDNPTISGSPLTSIAKNQTYNFTPTAEDVDGDKLTFSILNKPSWLTFDKDTGQLTGVPVTSDTGLYENILITVSDGRGGTASLPIFSIEVINKIISNGDITAIAYEDEEFTYELSNNYTGATIYGISSAPTGMTIDEDSGKIEYTPPVGSAGNVTFTVTAGDGSNTVNNNFILTIKKRFNCNGPFETDFSNGSDGWYYRGLGGTNTNYGGEADDYISKGKITIPGYSSYNGNTYIYRSFYFGTGCENKEITISFYYETKKWENSDNLKLITSLSPKTTTPIETYYKTDGENVSNTIKTDSDAWITVFFYNEVNKNNESIKLDDIKLEIK